MNQEIGCIERVNRGIVLLLSAHVFFSSCVVEGQTSRLQSVDAVPAPTEILEAAERAMGTESARASVHSIFAIAACHGPNGDYETRTTSERSGNLSFQQFFPDRRNIAGILDGRGWQLGQNGRPEWIDATETSVLRGHEFSLIALDLRKRFHDFKTIGRTQFEGQPANRIAMTDELGNPATSYFSLTTQLPIGLTVTNARAGGPRTITIRFDSWRLTDGVKLVSHVTIFHGSRIWVFDFKTLKLNSAGKEAFQIPTTPTALTERK